LSDEIVIAYVYSLGQTNKTIGFIPFSVPAGAIYFEHLQKIVWRNDALSQKNDYENLFGIHIKRACELGTIGLQALEPKGLREFLIRPKCPIIHLL